MCVTSLSCCRCHCHLVRISIIQITSCRKSKLKLFSCTLSACLCCGEVKVVGGCVRDFIDDPPFLFTVSIQEVQHSAYRFLSISTVYSGHVTMFSLCILLLLYFCLLSLLVCVVLFLASVLCAVVSCPVLSFFFVLPCVALSFVAL
jgi:hypothetical protein